MKQFSLDSAWRAQRLSHIQFLVRLHGMGLTVNPLFDCPFFSVDIFKIDWLHTMDLGVLADVIGNVFWEALPLLPRKNRGEQVMLLWHQIQEYYVLARVPGRLDNSTEGMIKCQGKSPKQRGRAA
jgi:hypothetical protein